MNSGMGGMSIFSICRFIIFVASAEKPGRAPSQVGRCMPGLPTVATLIFSKRSLRIASSPKKVKKVGLDPFHAGAVRHDQAGVDPFERALRDHDRDLLDRGRRY